MTIIRGYCTLNDLKIALDRETSDTDDDAEMEAAIEAASRWIDGHCHTRFFTSDADEARTYTARNKDLVFTDDIVSLSAVAIDDEADYSYGQALTATDDYLLEPANAPAKSKPYWNLRRKLSSSYVFPTHAEGVKLTGKFGYSSSAPADVKRACIRRAAQLFRTAGATGGAVGAAEYGTMQALPAPDAMVLFLLQQIANERKGRPY